MDPAISSLGDAALLVEFGQTLDDGTIDRVHALAARVGASQIASDIVPAYASLAVHLAADASAIERATDEITRLMRAGAPELPRSARREITLSVHYGGEDGPDLEEAAAALEISAAELVARHTAADYRVAFLGFSPGFPYLRGLDPRLMMPRRATPRALVPAGTVAIGGAQTGIYPSATPGGWHLIGRTGARLFDPYRAEPCLLRAGDGVRFRAVEQIAEEPLQKPPALGGMPALHVEHPGLLSTLQDLGRPGHQHLGVTPGGALDRFSHSVANLLVSNREEAPALEITMLGPRLVAAADLVIALCGARFDATVDGARLPRWQAVPVRRGARIAIGTPAAGARAYLAVAGGFAALEALGGRGTALRDRFGGFYGRALRKGDTLYLADDPAVRAERHAVMPHDLAAGTMKRLPDALVEPRAGALRVVRGPHWGRLDGPSQRSFTTGAFTVSPQSDRMGLRLEGSALRFAAPVECISAGVATGTIQLPPDGHPIVLLADRQTTGGYPRLGEIITADLDHLAQLRPGDGVRFTFVTLREAHAEAAAAEARWQKVRDGVR